MRYKRISDFPISTSESAEVLGLKDGNNVRISVLSKNATEDAIKNISIRSKGYFTSAEDLRSSIPTAKVGDRAYVGVTPPYAIYEWNEEDGWFDSGKVGGSDGIPITINDTDDTADYKDVF